MERPWLDGLDECETCAKTFATFALTGDRIDPEQVSARLGVEADHPDGRPSSIIAAGSRTSVTVAWSLSTMRTVESRNLERHLWALIDRLAPVRDALDDVCRDQDLRAEFFCIWQAAAGEPSPWQPEGPGTGGPYLSPAILAAVHHLGAAMSLYFLPADPPEASTALSPGGVPGLVEGARVRRASADLVLAVGSDRAAGVLSGDVQPVRRLHPGAAQGAVPRAVGRHRRRVPAGRRAEDDEPPAQRRREAAFAREADRVVARRFDPVLVVNVEFLEDDPKPVLLLWGGTPAEIIQLRSAVDALASGATSSVNVTGLPGVSGVDGTRLQFTAAADDAGVVAGDATGLHTCELTVTSWRRVHGLMEPFTRALDPEQPSFQFLVETGEVELIVASHRGW